MLAGKGMVHCSSAAERLVEEGSIAAVAVAGDTPVLDTAVDTAAVVVAAGRSSVVAVAGKRAPRGTGCQLQQECCSIEVAGWDC